MQISTKSIKQRVLSGGAWSFSTKLMSGLLTVGITGLVARILSPDDLGVFFLSFSVVMFAAVLGRVGIDSACVRLVTETLVNDNPEKAKKIIIDVLGFVFVVSILISAIYYFLIGEWVAEDIFSSQSMSQYTLYISIWMVLLTLQLTLAEIFRSYHRIDFASIFSSGTIYGGFFSSILTMVMLISAWIFGAEISLKNILILILVTICAGNLVALLFVYKHFNHIKASTEANIKALLRIGIPLLVTAVSFFVLSQADVWILGIYRTEGEVALYGSSQRLMKITAMTLVVVNEVVAPIVVELNAKKEYSKMQKILQTLAFVAVVPALVSMFVFVVFGEDIMSIVYGEYYMSAAVLLIILSIGQLFNSFTGSCGLTLVMTGHQDWVMFSSLITGILAIVGCILVVDDYGVEGVAIVMVSSLVLQNVVMLLMVKYKLSIWTFAKIRIKINK